MSDENKNLKDETFDLDIIVKDTSHPISYNKTNKLITALYMVTDMIDKEEPIRNKLRTLGTGIISDIHEEPSNACAKILELMSFLNIARTMNIISEMNCSILRKEFMDLDDSIKGSSGKTYDANKAINLSEFFGENLLSANNAFSGNSYYSIGHETKHNFGIQKGNTLMKALSDKIGPNSKKTEPISNGHETNKKSLKTDVLDDFYIIKKERRYNIIESIKLNGGSATITDIKSKAIGALVSCSDKTLQRELALMVKDNVLDKTGEKRWSKYSVKNQVV